MRYRRNPQLLASDAADLLREQGIPVIPQAIDVGDVDAEAIRLGDQVEIAELQDGTFMVSVRHGHDWKLESVEYSLEDAVSMASVCYTGSHAANGTPRVHLRDSADKVLCNTRMMRITSTDEAHWALVPEDRRCKACSRKHRAMTRNPAASKRCWGELTHWVYITPRGKRIIVAGKANKFRFFYADTEQQVGPEVSYMRGVIEYAGSKGWVDEKDWHRRQNYEHGVTDLSEVRRARERGE